MTAAFDIGGDFNWNGTSTFDTTMTVIGNKIGTLGSVPWSLVCNNINYVSFDPVTTHLTLNQVTSGFNTNLNGDNILVSSISSVNMTATVGNISATAAGNVVIDSGDQAGGHAVAIGFNTPGNLVRLGNTNTNSIVEAIAYQVYCAGTFNTLIGGQATASLSATTAIYGNSIFICPASDCTALTLGYPAVTSWVTQGTTLAEIFTGAMTTTAGTLTLNSTNTITLHSTAHGLNFIATTSVDIECGPFSGGSTLNMGLNAGTYLRLGSSGASSQTDMQGTNINIGNVSNSLFRLGNSSSAWTSVGSTFSGTYSGLYSLDTSGAIQIGVASTSGITLGRTGSNVTVNANTLHLNADTGNTFLDSNTGTIFIGSVGTPASINIGQGLTGKPTIIQGGPTQVFGTDSLEMDSIIINFADVSCTALNIGNTGCVTKLILPTPAVGTQPLLIDADGTIHV